jgi:NTP pyrophosphatase (non-canonical NTP hydrolase)
VKELTLITRETAALFDQHVGKWPPSVMMIELAAEVGTLADSIMIKEGHRPARNEEDVIDLEDDIVDILFMLVRIADHYGIDLDAAYQKMIGETRQKLEILIEERSKQTPLDP